MALDQRIIHQLSSEDPKERRKAIIALADSRNNDALKLLDEADSADPNQPGYINLRGEIHDLVVFLDFYEAREWASKNLMGWHVKEEIV